MSKWNTGEPLVDIPMNAYENGKTDERERIIKLLEFELWEAFQKSHNELPAWATMGMLITAIKGENK